MKRPYLFGFLSGVAATIAVPFVLQAIDSVRAASASDRLVIQTVDLADDEQVALFDPTSVEEAPAVELNDAKKPEAENIGRDVQELTRSVRSIAEQLQSLTEDIRSIQGESASTEEGEIPDFGSPKARFAVLEHVFKAASDNELMFMQQYMQAVQQVRNADVQLNESRRQWEQFVEQEK